MATSEGQNEAALVCAAQGGDKEALRQLFTRNWSWLKGLVYSIIGGPDEVDDVLQDICVRVIEKIGSIRQPERFQPWLAILARRQALRHRQRAHAASRALRSEGFGPQHAAHGTQHELERGEQCEQIIRAIRSLPEKYREVFILEHGGDLTYRQIAEILDVPVTTVQIRLVRARRMIYDQVAGKDRSKVREG